MSLLEISIIAVGLAMDAFAVSITCGISSCSCSKLGGRPSLKCSFKVGAYFGFFQFFMPIIGWILGIKLQSLIVEFDHWVAFSLLGFIGGKMIYDSLFSKDSQINGSICETKSLLLLAIATSIDALIVGLSIAFLKANLLLSIVIIGVVTFALSFIGVYLGRTIGHKLKTNFELIGGVVLIGIGLKILTEHLIEKPI